MTGGVEVEDRAEQSANVRLGLVEDVIRPSEEVE
jgi:hypothetical protein